MRNLILLSLLLLTITASAQQKSAKRGISENSFTHPDEVHALAKGVTWYYNWGQTPSANVKNVVGPGQDVEFVPMIWNAKTDESGNLTNVGSLINYLDANPGVKYLLGFNEPNFKAQANMLPSEAAFAWPAVEAIAEKYDLGLVGPALNYSGEALSDGKVYQPEEWMDAFIASYKQQFGKEPRMDYMALHSYMNSPSAVIGFVEDFAKKYDRKVWLTEFCSWEGNVDSLSQQASLVQKLNLLEQSEHVYRYAWFKAKNSVVNPHYRLLVNQSVLTKLPAVGTLSNAGQFYVNLSGYDREKYYTPGETILAKDYVFCNASGLQLNTDTNNPLTTVVVSSFDTGSKLDYLVEVPESGEYNLEVRLSCRKFLQLPKIGLYIDDNTTATVQQEMAATGMTGTQDVWQTQTIPVTLPAGKHTLQLRSLQSTECKFNWIRLSLATGIDDVYNVDDNDNVNDDNNVYNLLGQRVTAKAKGIIIKNGKKILK